MLKQRNFHIRVREKGNEWLRHYYPQQERKTRIRQARRREARIVDYIERAEQEPWQ